MLEGMGRIYQNSGRFADAKLAFERSLALRRANGGGESAEVATTLLYMANTLRLLGSYAAADSGALQALRISESVNGPADPSTADAWQMLSMLAVYRGDISASEAYARRSVDIRVAAYGPDDPRIAYALEMLGGALRRLGRYDEGERYMRQALALYEREKGPNDPGLIVPLNRLAEAVATGRADYGEAARLMERAVAIATASLGEAHPRTAYSLELLGGLESRRGNFAKGERLSRLAVEMFRNARQARRRGRRRLRRSREGLLARGPVARCRGGAAHRDDDLRQRARTRALNVWRRRRRTMRDPPLRRPSRRRRGGVPRGAGDPRARAGTQTRSA